MLAASAAIITSSVLILGGFLLRYRRLVKEADESTRLAKDVWDSVNARFSVVDARLIDLMARTEVISSRMGPMQGTSQTRVSSASLDNASSPDMKRAEPTKSAQVQTAVEGTETELRVLHFLAQGPRTSAQIKEEVGRSREHTARLMKALFDRGLVIRNDRNKPYVYEITESGKSYVAS
jgi:predicted transcriptional regulator